MNKKKIAKYFLITIALGVIISALWAENGKAQLYGGNTEVVDYKKFNIPIVSTCVSDVMALRYTVI